MSFSAKNTRFDVRNPYNRLTVKDVAGDGKTDADIIDSTEEELVTEDNFRAEDLIDKFSKDLDIELSEGGFNGALLEKELFEYVGKMADASGYDISGGFKESGDGEIIHTFHIGDGRDVYKMKIGDSFYEKCLDKTRTVVDIYHMSTVNPETYREMIHNSSEGFDRVLEYASGVAEPETSENLPIGYNSEKDKFVYRDEGDGSKDSGGFSSNASERTRKSIVGGEIRHPMFQDS